MIRAGVVGVGSIGRHHARIYSELEGVELVAVADPALDRALAVANRLKIPAYPDCVSLFEKEHLDIVSTGLTRK
jgi:UDP-N-acetylglucosamine 3-dehydrogenase